jgi:hypothetical protein
VLRGTPYAHVEGRAHRGAAAPDHPVAPQHTAVSGEGRDPDERGDLGPPNCGRWMRSSRGKPSWLRAGTGPEADQQAHPLARGPRQLCEIRRSQRLGAAPN